VDAGYAGEAGVVLCRECERLLLRARAACPWCLAQRPGAHVRARRQTRVELWVLAPALSAPALLAGDVVARWLLRSA
jgi:hypothetical protein